MAKNIKTTAKTSTAKASAAKAKASKASTAKRAKPVLAAVVKAAPAKRAAPAPVPEVTMPGGKLGVVVKRLSRARGVTIDELMDELGWTAHTVRGALSRLRARGFNNGYTDNGARRAYGLIDG